MAQSFNITANAKRDAAFFQESVDASKVLSGDFMRVIPNVGVGGVMVNKLFSVDTIGAADGQDCSWTAAEALDVADKKLTVAAKKYTDEICGQKVEGLLSENAFQGTKRGQVPASLQDAAMRFVTRKIGYSVDGSVFSTLETAAAADADVIDVTATTFTRSNILEEVGKIYAEITPEMFSEAAATPDARLYMYMNSGDFYKYLLPALGEAATETNVVLPNFVYIKETGKVFYLGVEIVPVAGITANNVLCGAYQNFIIGTDIIGGDAEVKIGYGSGIKDEDTLFIKSRWLIGATYVSGAEVVYYHP